MPFLTLWNAQFGGAGGLDGVEAEAVVELALVREVRQTVEVGVGETVVLHTVFVARHLVTGELAGGHGVPERVAV